jgi:dihydropteroate synthase
MQKRYHWKLKQREVVLFEKTLLMGILNVTPDSFSDGGLYNEPDKALARALEMEAEGADILDVGAESTKPGSARISEAEELRRLVPVLKKLKGMLTIPISVDTYKAAVAEKALEHGAEIINDPSGLMHDQQLAKIVTKHDAGLIINHMRGTPETWSRLPPIKDLMRTLHGDLEAAANRARQAGVLKHQIVLDPGLGFGKRREQNAEIIAKLGALRTLDFPLLLGPSRKTFLQKEQAVEVEFATAAAVAACVLNGAHIVRVHSVKEMRSAIDIADMIRQATVVEEELPADEPRTRTLPRQDEPAPRKRPPLRRAGTPDSSASPAGPERFGK